MLETEVQAGRDFVGLACLQQACILCSLPAPVIFFRRPGLSACHFIRPAWPACTGLSVFYVNIVMIKIASKLIILFHNSQMAPRNSNE
jgi:hypothetical protein